MNSKHADVSTSHGNLKAAERKPLGKVHDRCRCATPLILPACAKKRESPKPGEFLRNFWAVTETGNWSRDLAIGRSHARDAIRFMREERAPHVLNWIASDMARKRHHGPVEIGFFHELGRALIESRGKAGRRGR